MVQLIAIQTHLQSATRECLINIQVWQTISWSPEVLSLYKPYCRKTKILKNNQSKNSSSSSSTSSSSGNSNRRSSRNSSYSSSSGSSSSSMLVQLLEEGSSIILRSSTCNSNSNSNRSNFSCSARFTHLQNSRSDLHKKILQLLIPTASHNKRQWHRSR